MLTVKTRIIGRIAATVAVAALLVGGFSATSFAASAAPTKTADGSTGEGTPDGTVKGGRIAFAGSIAEIADAPARADSSLKLFLVSGLGYLWIDASQVAPELAMGEFTAWFELPEAVAVAEDTETTFRTLATYSTTVNPLVAESAVAISGGGEGSGGSVDIDAMINRTPITATTHKIFAVPVTPNGSSATVAAASQSQTNIQNAITYADNYWNAQTAGKVRFELTGTTSWYKTAISCNAAVDTNAAALWNEAANLAFTQLGYRASASNHLVLFFPSGTDCGPAAGLATLGYSVNTGGPAWIVGSSTNAYEYGTVAHELGHSLSLAHADWADCGTSPSPGLSGSAGCTLHEYGDLIDTMGGGSLGGRSGGALSSPNAIRSSMWDTSAYAIAPQGTTTSYVLSSVSDHAGLRSVIVQDSQGYEYFVEFRNYTNEDAQFASDACTTNYCNSLVDGVRILRQSSNGYYKGYAIDHSYLIGHTVGGSKKTTYVAGESFATNGVTVSVSAITATTATVSITRPTASLTSDRAWMIRTVNASDSSDYQLRVGDTWTAFVGSWWNADSYSFQWYRSGKAISGATKQSYVISSSDKGKALKVKVTGKRGSTSKSTYDPIYYSGYTVYGGIMAAGSVSIDYSATPYVAKPKAWTVPGVSLKYQWYRSGAAISGATSSTYSPTTSDRDKSLTVKVSASKSGYNSLSATSSATPDRTLDSVSTAVISGTAQVGQTLSVGNLTYTYPGGSTVGSPVRSYQWYRSGSKITGAVNQTYVLGSSDYGKKMTVSVTGGLAGYIPHTTTSAATTTVIKGVFNGTLAVPVVTETDLATRTLTAALPGGSVTDASPSLSYQWYRDTSKISRATKSYYKLSSSDYGKAISVRVKVSKSNYTSIYLTSVPQGYSLIPSMSAPQITGTLANGQTITAVAPTFTLNSVATTTDPLTYQWYRDTKAVSGAVFGSYTLSSSDVGKAIYVKVTATKLGALSWSKYSAKTQKIGSSTLPMAGWNAQANATVTKDPVTKTLSVVGTGITEPDVKISYQWYRGSSAISKQTKSYYKLSSSDYNKLISVRVTTSKSTFTTIVKYSTQENYSVVPAAAVTISDTTPTIGDSLSAVLPAFTTAGSPYVPGVGFVTYQWYRETTKLSGQTAATYTVVSADKGKRMTVKIVVSKDGFLSSGLTSAKTSKVVSAP
jgi:hypothetical protein